MHCCLLYYIRGFNNLLLVRDKFSAYGTDVAKFRRSALNKLSYYLLVSNTTIFTSYLNSSVSHKKHILDILAFLVHFRPPTMNCLVLA